MKPSISQDYVFNTRLNQARIWFVITRTVKVTRIFPKAYKLKSAVTTQVQLILRYIYFTNLKCQQLCNCKTISNKKKNVKKVVTYSFVTDITNAESILLYRGGELFFSWKSLILEIFKHLVNKNKIIHTFMKKKNFFFFIIKFW